MTHHPPLCADMPASSWHKTARPEQRLPEGPWRVWLVMAGRGFGKTRTGAETVRIWATQKGYRRIALLGQTEQDVRSVMVEGESGLLNVCAAGQDAPVYQPSRRQLVWPNGALAQTYGADRHDKLRGPQFDAAWVDELAKFRKAAQVWDQLMFCLRLGPSPRVIVTTTPRPLPLVKNLLNDPGVVLSRGSTFDNASHLSPAFLETMRQSYEGTPLGDQELHARIVNTTEHTLWTPEMIRQAWTSDGPPDPRSLSVIVVGVDPAVSEHEQGDETGIVVAARDPLGNGYVLGDYSLRSAPAFWVPRVIEAYRHHRAHLVVAETNQGGDLVSHLLRVSDPGVRVRSVRAVRSKRQRAEPVAALYRQGRIRHTVPLPVLEQQMMQFPEDLPGSPDRLDALVWAMTELFLARGTDSAEKIQLWHL